MARRLAALFSSRSGWFDLGVFSLGMLLFFCANLGALYGTDSRIVPAVEPNFTW